MKSYYDSIEIPVNELVELVYKHFGKNPMSWTKIDKLTEYAHGEQFVSLVFSLFERLKDQGGMLDVNPSQLYKIIYKFQLAAKELDYIPESIMQCYMYFANYSVKLYNMIYSNAASNSMLIDYICINNKEELKKLLFLSAAIRSYSEVIYWDEHTIAGEIISPIMYTVDSFVIYRKYNNLNASELYKELADFPYKSIELYFLYNSKSPPHTDIVGNLLTTDNISEKIVGFYIALSSKEGTAKVVKSTEEIEYVTNIFVNYLTNMTKIFKDMSLEDRLWKKIECEYYSLKEIAEKCGIEWRPHKYDISVSKIANPQRPIVKANQEIASLNDESIIKKKLFELNDPRVHWPYL